MLAGMVHVDGEEGSFEGFFMRGICPRETSMADAESDVLGVDNELGQDLVQDDAHLERKQDGSDAESVCTDAWDESECAQLAWVDAGDAEAKRVLQEWDRERRQSLIAQRRGSLRESKELTRALCAGEHPLKAKWIRARMAEREDHLREELLKLQEDGDEQEEDEVPPGHLDYVPVMEQLEGPLKCKKDLMRACNERLERLAPDWRMYGSKFHGIEGCVRGINEPREGHVSVLRMRAFLSGSCMDNVRTCVNQVAGRWSGNSRRN